MAAEMVVRLLEQRVPRERLHCTAGGGRSVTVEIAASDVKAAVGALLQGKRPRFVTLTAVDRGEDIALLYTLVVEGVLTTLRTSVAKEVNTTESIADVLPAAELGEKEVSELFGIDFVGHPRRTNLMLPDEWPADKTPLRKPLVGSVIPQARLTVENLLRDAASVRVSPSSMSRREKAGLPKRPAMASASEESMKEFIDLVMRTGFDKRAGYDWEKRRLRYR